MTFAILCPGQGGQHAAQFGLVADDVDARRLIGQAGDAIGVDLFDVVRDPQAMFVNAIAQPLICATQAATWSLLRPRLAARGIEPALVAGYSVGELSAWRVAGALSFDDVVAIAGDRARLMDAAGIDGDGLMALRGLAVSEVRSLCATHGAHVAIVNGEDQWIVGGHRAALDAIAIDAVARGTAIQRLPVSVAAHTPTLTAAVEPFRARLNAAAWRPATSPVLAGIDASATRDVEQAIDRLARQVATTIDWAACLDGLQERGVTVALELGPGSALARMLHERHGEIAVRSVDEFRSVDAVVEWVVRGLAATP